MSEALMAPFAFTIVDSCMIRWRTTCLRAKTAGLSGPAELAQTTIKE